MTSAVLIASVLVTISLKVIATVMMTITASIMILASVAETSVVVTVSPLRLTTMNGEHITPDTGSVRARTSHLFYALIEKNLIQTETFNVPHSHNSAQKNIFSILI